MQEFAEKFVDILILFNNKSDQTIECINSFLPSGQNILLLNNGSDPNEAKVVIDFIQKFESVKYYDSQINLGVSAGRNFLIHQSKSEWLFFVDNDICVRDSLGWLNEFKEFIRLNSDANIISPLLFNVHENDFAHQLKVVIENENVEIVTGQFYETNCFSGGASIVKRDLFERYLNFDEEIFVGFEDYEFAIRAIINFEDPFRVLILKNIILDHNHKIQKSKAGINAVKVRYNSELHEKSMLHIKAKYGLNFRHEWAAWVQAQKAIMIKQSVFGRIRKRILSILKIIN